MPLGETNSILSRRPTRMRVKPTRGGLKADAVDRTGGDHGVGLIRGVGVVTRGEALGHGAWLDSEFLRQTLTEMNRQQPVGLKARFTHPSLSADGLGKYLGRIKDGYYDGDVLRGDLHFSSMAHETPDGDLAAYVMGLADEDPAAFGTSIVFTPDYWAEDLFEVEHSDAKGNFKSPDPDNADNLPHARIHELHADDVVDDPAANPDGLFHRGQELAQEADGLLAYSLGLTDQAPRLMQLDLDADRVTQFVQRFLEHHGLQFTTRTKERTMSEDTAREEEVVEGTTKDTGENVEMTQAENDDAVKTRDVLVTQDDLDRHNEVIEQGLRAECKRFVEAFGEKGGVWYAEGLDFDEAQEKYIAGLKAVNEKLQQKLAAVDRGEDESAEFQVGSEEKLGGKAGAEAAANYGDGLAPLVAFNAAKLPNRN